MLNVSLVKGRDSYSAVRRALELIQDDVRVPPTSKPVLIKPNIVSGKVELAATPVAAVRAVLDFLQELGVRKFILGEGTAEGGDTMGAFQRFGYMSLKDDYDLEVVDLNQDETVEAVVFGADLKPVTLRIARTVADSYRVSVARMKTHDTVIVTLAIKNMAVGSIVHRDRKRLSHAFPAMNFSLAKMNMERPPDLSVIDGVVGMEGRGPVSGTAVSSGVALAGVDSTAVDVVGARVMGYDPSRIGYLYYLMDMKGLSPQDIRVLGENPGGCVISYKHHPTYESQLKWHVDGWRRVYAAAQ
jgi:uncharacterized protein (DUF362 family)